MTTTLVTCAQCGRSVPSDAPELEAWRYGRLAVAGELDETSANILLCPDCAEEDALGAYDAGDAD